jgi:hypothetical protein
MGRTWVRASHATIAAVQSEVVEQHLAARGSNVKHCGSILPDVRDYFHRDLDRTAENKRARQRQSLLREKVAIKGDVAHNIDSDNDEELQRAIHLSRNEMQYAR